jgi:hypothetical protein
LIMSGLHSRNSTNKWVPKACNSLPPFKHQNFLIKNKKIPKKPINCQVKKFFSHELLDSRKEKSVKFKIVGS